MPKTIHFNTGRLYTKLGQQITATLHDDNVVTFMDHSRAVYGEFERSKIRTELELEFTSEEVMREYDAPFPNKISHSRRAHEDGMYRGNNAKYEGS